MVIKLRTRPMLRKLGETQAIQIRLRLEKGESLAQLAREFGVGLGTIQGIKKWATYRDCFPYKWES